MDTEEQRAVMETILSELKAKNVECALIRKDGLLVHTTITLEEGTPNLIASLSNIAEELMREVSDRDKEMEITFDGIFMVLLPVKTYLLCGIVKQRESKQDLRAAAEKLKAAL
jgi:hypothetical protein